jgi:formate dehydrogenase maturation protein FdhE
MELVIGLLLAAVAFGLYVAVQERRANEQVKVCAACGTMGPTRMHTGGSAVLAVLLWLGAFGLVGYRAATAFTLPPLASALYSVHWWVLLVPLAYGAYRASTRKRVCPACGSSQLVPPDSPVGRRVRESGGASA